MLGGAAEDAAAVRVLAREVLEQLVEQHRYLAPRTAHDEA
jgi:hypothetical protein